MFVASITAVAKRFVRRTAHSGLLRCTIQRFICVRRPIISAQVPVRSLGGSPCLGVAATAGAAWRQPSNGVVYQALTG
jgi:hypothetical protein